MVSGARGVVRPRHSRIHPVEDDDYRIHYTITSPAFRRLYFSAVEMNNTCKAAEIFGANESYWLVGSSSESFRC